jgi:hypothetical protein
MYEACNEIATGKRASLSLFVGQMHVYQNEQLYFHENSIKTFSFSYALPAVGRAWPTPTHMMGGGWGGAGASGVGEAAPPLRRRTCGRLLDNHGPV